jgi:hypothetical protein
VLSDRPNALPATVIRHGRTPGIDGPVEAVAVHCAADHRFIGAADTLRRRLPAPEQPIKD